MENIVTVMKKMPFVSSSKDMTWPRKEPVSLKIGQEITPRLKYKEKRG